MYEKFESEIAFFFSDFSRLVEATAKDASAADRLIKDVRVIL